MYTVASQDRLLTFAVQIVSDYVRHNNMQSEVLPSLIENVYDTLASIAPSDTTGGHDSPAHHTAHDHVHSNSATHSDTANDDFLVCLEDGLTMKMLKRHLLTVHGLTPDEYRAKWGLPNDYPMVTATYAKLRSSLAKESGLGLRPEARPKRRRV